MPVRQLYRTPMQQRLEILYHRIFEQVKKEKGPDAKLPFTVYILKAYLVLNPDYSKLLSKNFSFLEGVGGYLGRFLLLANGQPDRNLTYWFNRLIRDHNTSRENLTSKLVRNAYDFETVTRPTRIEPDGHTIITTYRIIELLRGNDSVDLLQQDQDWAAAGIAARRVDADLSRDEGVVDVSVRNLLRRYGL